MTRAHFVERARKNYPAHKIKKGQSYWWWKFRKSGKHYSLTAPKRAQLTQSEFWGAVYNLQDSYSDTPQLMCDVESQIESAKSELENLRDETQGKLDNMPEGLQESSVLNERLDAIDSAISDLESIDYSYEPDEAEAKDDDFLQDRISEIWDQVTTALDLSCS